MSHPLVKDTGLQTIPFGPAAFFECNHSSYHFHALPIILELRLAQISRVQHIMDSI
jgi:hypothetical protein